MKAWSMLLPLLLSTWAAAYSKVEVPKASGPAHSILVFGQLHPEPPEGLKQQLFDDLAAVKEMRFKSVTPLFRTVFGGDSGEDLVRWWFNHIWGVEYDPNSDNFADTRARPRPRKADQSYSAIDEEMGQTILGPKYFIPERSQMDRVATLFHEARHTEARSGNKWLHTKCPDPFLDVNGGRVKGRWNGMDLSGAEDTCDREALGAYGVSVILMKNIELNCGNCSEVTKRDARLSAEDQIKRLLVNPKAYDVVSEDAN